MSDLIVAVENAIAELDDHYDGAPDSPTLWLGSIIRDLNNAVASANRAILACEEDRDREERTLNRRTI